MFGIMGLLFILPFFKSEWPAEKKVRMFVLITILVSAWGFITECIQLYVPGRDFDLLDWGADSLGAFIVFFWLKRRMKSESLQNISHQ